MIYIRLENFIPVEVSTSHPKCQGDGLVWAFKVDGKNHGDGWITRNDIASHAYANTLAALLTEKLGRTFLGTDAGSHTSPRYDVIEAPKLGDEVSASQNGDTYPEGTIVKITPTWQITTSTGCKFRRVKESAGWKKSNGYSWMTSGHHYEQNPSF